ncbi:SNF2 family N-terminal domain-domain-containing protein [Naematelia encephala]|uniref:SNF2 family N-terminal domain-domain-containing protein n=1 Tax=Naematelia encephala TaxID=71784 RepID=A0A1Y2BE95_9TREE|nr:SNF2 family N-terminal domain-domain-containing protein [Naematelia encephala]
MDDPFTMAEASNSSRRPPPSSTKRALSPDERVKEQVKEELDEIPPTPVEPDELYVTMRTDVVGVQYYTGMVGRGEYVMLERQPDNQYDSNAVRVMNASGHQVGHVPRAVASQLAYLMDERLITVEGRMVGQNLEGGRHFKLALDMSIYGRPSLRQVLEPELIWATPGQRGFEAMRRGDTGGSNGNRLGGDTMVIGPGGSGSSQPLDEEMRRLLDGLKKVENDEKHADGVMDNLTADIDVSKLPLHPSPPGVANGQLQVDLLPHQSQALQWMISRENPKLPSSPSDPPVQFWVRQNPEAKGNGKPYWLNVATRTPQTETPELGRGGIIADGMGLGKTLSTLALILATKGEKIQQGNSKATLIVCPLSVLSNWEKQIRDHVTPGQLTYYVYHGASRGVTPASLSSYDVVITTYQMVAADGAGVIPATKASPAKSKKVKTGKGPLLAIKWKRVVADEGHVLKNPRAKMTQAFVAVEAERRWVCTGTPIVNSPADLGSLLTCLKVCKPLDQDQYFKSLLLRPLRNGSAAAGKLLQALVGQILIRRTKETKDAAGSRLVELPPLEFFQVPIELDDETRTVYDEVQAACANKFQETLRSGEGTLGVLSMLTRLRQLCLSRQLVPQTFLEDLRRPASAVPSSHAVNANSLGKVKTAELVDRLRQAVSDDEECPVCFDAPMAKPRISVCGHCFCLECISTVIEKQAKCPMDRNALSLSSLIELPPDASDFIEPDDDVAPIKSAKITELIKYLKMFDPSDKTLVFSQFTSFLDHVAAALREEGIRFCRFDGSMSAKQRQEVITSFQAPVTAANKTKTAVVMLISLKSGAVGLNLTAASNVFLCDPWWQSAIEAQAIDRVHRMGQRKPVRVFQLIAEDTVEAKVLDIQKRKDELVAKAFEKTSRGQTAQEKRQARFDELKELFGVK